VIHYDNKNQGNTRLNITIKNTIDRLNIYFGRLCHHQEIHKFEIKLLRVRRGGRWLEKGERLKGNKVGKKL
jgi:hypothetical protein